MTRSVNLAISGQAGQGIATVESLLTKALKRSGLNVFASREYMSRVRGGINSTAIRVSSQPVHAFEDRIDILIPLSDEAIPHLQHRMTNNTLVIGEKAFLSMDLLLSFISIEVPFTELAKEIGSILYSNIIALGVISSIFKVERQILHDLIEFTFLKKGDKVIQPNKSAINKGYEIGAELEDKYEILKKFYMNKNPEIKNDLILDGTESIALGAIAGGVQYECFYPMAPSTGIGTFLAQQASKFGLIVDMSEDEISVINKALGASYAGARSLVTTSGGGFSLMTEAISLAGMLELPIVVVVGQRPGPATGMPTRTTQEDLRLVLHAGAGFFPRIIFAPGCIEDSFYLTQKAFDLAQKYQVPVFILTDQYLVDSYYNLPFLNLDSLKNEKFIVKTDKDYQRFKFTKSGISPRGIPGYGEGLVAADSHTHTEAGMISEDPEIREKSVEKRLKKLKLIKDASIPPEFIGDANKIKYQIVSWGSTYYIIKEALDKINRSDIGFLHFSQVYPIHESTKDYLKKAKINIMVEQNPTGQFANLIENEIHIQIDKKILKYSGYTLSVEDIVAQITDAINGGN
ncbi:MAG: 2-oxoacid:acceptor oxidoreductase subunit alpha [Promethearchaeota archaeon]|nr:MAG: 2-oxoacid:acceptor oxidoreductase subunit alpha [Candidatus Lokiarchaeota archaeon]